MEIITDFLQRYFGYEEAVVYGICQELCEYGVFALEGEGVLFPTHRNQTSLRPLPKLAGILGGEGDNLGRGVLGEVAYLNLCGMRALVSASSLDPSMGVPFFRALSFRDCSVQEWKRCKVMNSISILRSLLYLDELEGIGVEAYATTHTQERDRVYKEILAALELRSHVPRLMAAALKQLAAICQTMDEAERHDLSRWIKSYEATWCDETERTWRGLESSN